MFTVVIPLYNKEDFILTAVNSVLQQSFEDFELLIINDGSTDSSLEKLKSIRDSRLKIINQDNQGVGAARNTGFKNAKFEWIAFLDADDFWSPAHLNELYKIIQSHPSSRMVSTQNIIINVNDQPYPLVDENANFKIREIDYFFEAAKKLTVVHSSSVAINKHVYNSIGGFSNHKMGEDLEYWARVALNYNVAISERPTSYYCVGTGGVSEHSDKTAYDKPREKFKSLEQVSPTFMLLMQKAREDKSILKRKGIRSYINNSLYSGAKIWVYQGNSEVAKDLASLALPQLTIKYPILYIISRSPVNLLQLINITYRKMNTIR